MSTTLQQVTLNGTDLWLVADPGTNEGPLCSEPEDFAQGRESHAHLFPSGAIMRHQEKIGEFKDLEFTGVCQEVEHTEEAFGNLFSW